MLLFNMEKEKLDRIIKMIRFYFSLSTEAEAEAESLPVCNGQSGTSSLNHSDEEAVSSETSGNQINVPVSKEPPLLRELNPDLLQSGKFKLTGKCQK